MKMLYIKEKEENTKLKQKIKNYFNIIEIEYVNNKVLLTLPINYKSKEKKIIKVAKKLNKILYKDCIQNIVLSKDLFKSETLKNILYSQNINILDGSKLFSLLTNKVIKQICTYAGAKIEELEISVLVNDSNSTNIANITEIAKNVKRLNIITNHIEKFEKLQDYLYNELGIMIKISNNKKKDLLNSQIILNIDFVEELINNYKLPYKCVFINLCNKINIKSKQFNGIMVNHYNIIMNETYKIQKFENEVVYESLIYNCSSQEAQERIEMDNIQIKALLGKNGRINEKEFKQIIN